MQLVPGGGRTRRRKPEEETWICFAQRVGFFLCGGLQKVSIQAIQSATQKSRWPVVIVVVPATFPGIEMLSRFALVKRRVSRFSSASMAPSMIGDDALSPQLRAMPGQARVGELWRRANGEMQSRVQAPVKMIVPRQHHLPPCGVRPVEQATPDPCDGLSARGFGDWNWDVGATLKITASSALTLHPSMRSVEGMITQCCSRCVAAAAGWGLALS